MLSDTNTVVTMFTTGDWQPCVVTSTASGELLVRLRKDNQNSYTEEDIKALSVTIDFNGHDFITDRPRNKIYMLDRDGWFLSFIIPEEGIEEPHSVCMIGLGEVMMGECMTGFVKRIEYLRIHQFIYQLFLRYLDIN